MTSQRESRFRSVIARRQPTLTVVFENVHDPHNIAACMRSCDAVGVMEIFIINNKEASSKRTGKKSSSSARKWLAVHHFENVADCFAEVRKKYAKIYSTKLGADSISLHDLRLTGSVALVFGNEHDGVSPEAAKLSDGNFLIPQFGMIQSLNISVACAVTLYEALRQRIAAGMYDAPQLSPAAAESLFQSWSEQDLRDKI